MKHICLVFLVAILASCKQAPKGIRAILNDPVEAAAPDTTAEVLVVNTRASTIKWLGTKYGGSHAGEIKLSGGKLHLKESIPVSGQFTINMKSIVNTDIPETDPVPKRKIVEHLMSDDFFAVEKFPISTFEITSVAPGETKDVVSLSGNLTIRGVTRNITFPAEVTLDPNDTLRAFADFNIDRQEWGISYTGARDEMIHDIVNLKIELVAGPEL